MTDNDFWFLSMLSYYGWEKAVRMWNFMITLHDDTSLQSEITNLKAEVELYKNLWEEEKEVYQLSVQTENELRTEVKHLKAEVATGLDIAGSFFQALKPLNLPRIYVNNPGKHVTDLIEECYRLRVLLEQQLSKS